MRLDLERRRKFRHGSQADAFSIGRVGEHWGDQAFLSGEIEKIINVLSLVLPTSFEEGDKKVFFSPSANTAKLETIIKAKLGKKYNVLAGDFAKLEVNPEIKGNAFRANAILIPLKTSSVDVIFDYRGAMWYELDADVNQHSGGEYTKELMAGYRRVLKPGGIVVVDHYTPPNSDYNSTKQLFDKCFEKGLIEGFEKPFLIGTPPYQLMVFELK